jgi:small-conductance mechanosensitive channel
MNEFGAILPGIAIPWYVTHAVFFLAGMFAYRKLGGFLERFLPKKLSFDEAVQQAVEALKKNKTE